MNWDEFKEAAPEMAAHGAELFDRVGVVMIGTNRKDGSPRISPVEHVIAHSQLYLGMMWQSLKARDLLRDPRCVVHNVISDRHAKEGEFKLYGRALNIEDADERRRYGQALYEKIGWNPEGMNYHLFAVDIQSAALFTTEASQARILKRWRAGEQVCAFRQGVDGQLIPIS
ncbi:MAG: pyridoxamine 5'-phosphate oxidase family protein [Acidobacteria bacterium]|nr:pyridoxamine 5'-phosphate oxidase family protein [Acidobacteriota bacterium]